MHMAIRSPYGKEQQQKELEEMLVSSSPGSGRISYESQFISCFCRNGQPSE